ncbi:conserved hypothetical protein [Burkholderia vietnamiensis]|nr:conserved hypothetical protein [Burkholderia vietnamiensis]
MRPRQGARRLIADQRDVLHPRQRARLRQLVDAQRPRALDLSRLPAVLQEGRDARRRPERLPRRRRPRVGHDQQAGREPAVRSDGRGRRAGRLSAHRRPQRLSAGRLRPDGPHRHAEGPPREHRARLPRPGEDAPQPRDRHARAGRPHPVRRQARVGRRIPARQRARDRACAPRGARVQRRDRVAATAAALGRRPRCMAEGARHPDRAGPAGGRPEPAGSSGDVHPVRMQGARLAVSGAQVVEPAEDRARMDAERHGPRREQPFRGRRLHPHARRRSLAEHPVSLPARRDQLQRLERDRDARLPGARRLDALAEPGPREAALARPERPSEHPVQLHGRSARLARIPRCDPRDARDHAATGARPLSRPRVEPGRRLPLRQGTRYVRARARRDRVPSVVLVQDGLRRHGRGRRRRPRAWAGRAAGRRRVDHADHHDRQPERADDHDRGEDRRPDSRASAARACERRVLRRERRAGAQRRESGAATGDGVGASARDDSVHGSRRSRREPFFIGRRCRPH